MQGPAKRAMLCEPGMTSLLRGALVDCKSKQLRHNTIILNIALIIIFIAVVGAFLYYSYKGRMSPEMASIKKRQDYEHIVERLTQLQVARDKRNGLITKLPLWDTRAAAAHLR